MEATNSTMSLRIPVTCCARYLDVAWLNAANLGANARFSLYDGAGKPIVTGANEIHIGQTFSWPNDIVYGDFLLLVEQDVTPEARLGLGQSRDFGLRVHYSPGYTQW
ncbi:MAG: hypothetical protein QOD77_1558 [Thermoplasmata archaeon]|nr:hypothetical protein [Thermoplasmata archaeon]